MTSVADLVFTRILAMDSYNRGYGVEFLPLGGVGSQLGNATFIREPAILGDSPAVAEGFYAAAYRVDGVTVISYRGTDTGWEFVATDFPISAGAWEDESTLLAMQFYNSVAAATDNPILLTGHSLGGGLAGFVASLTNRPAMLVDHMGFTTASANFISAWRGYMMAQAGWAVGELFVAPGTFLGVASIDQFRELLATMLLDPDANYDFRSGGMSSTYLPGSPIAAVHGNFSSTPLFPGMSFLPSITPAGGERLTMTGFDLAHLGDGDFVAMTFS